MNANRTNSDQFQLRLPPGLRERIKAYADRHGRSMNTEIVRILEREFPEPWSIGQRLGQLIEMTRVLKDGLSNEHADALNAAMRETIEAIVYKRISGVDDSAREELAELWNQFEEEEARAIVRAQNLDDEEIESLVRSGRPVKFGAKSETNEDGAK